MPYSCTMVTIVRDSALLWGRGGSGQSGVVSSHFSATAL